MQFTNPITQHAPGVFGESSSQQSPRERSSTGQLWKQANKIAQQTRDDTESLKRIQRRLENMGRRVGQSAFRSTWHWAYPPEYSADRAYSVDEVIIVSSDNPFAVNSGNSGAPNSADPGVYVNVRTTDSNVDTWATSVEMLPVVQSSGYTDSNGEWNSGVYWVPVGGGNGGPGELQQAQITNTLNANYIVVQLYDGSNASGSNMDVAKSIPSRMPSSWKSYTYSYLNDNSRTSNNGSNSEVQVMHPPFEVGDTIYISKSDHTGVTNGSTPVEWIEVNTERGWAHPSNTANINGVWVLTP